MSWEARAGFINCETFAELAGIELAYGNRCEPSMEEIAGNKS